MSESETSFFPAEPAATPLATGVSGPHDPGMEARVAVLEKIAANTEAMLAELRTDIRAVREKQEHDYRALSEKISGQGTSLNEKISAETLKLYEKISSETLKLYLAGGAAALAIMALLAKGFGWIK